MLCIEEMFVNKFIDCPPRPLSNILNDYGVRRQPGGNSFGEGSVLDPSKNDIVDALNREAAEYAQEHSQDPDE